jgi:aminomethyltransferase
MENLLKTPLFEIHQQLGAKIVDFGGWAMPVQYSGIIDETKATRERAGLFDVSHMGEIVVEGSGAKEYLQRMLTNDLDKVADNRILYSPMCYENGGTVDDLLVYRYREDKYLLVVNAANTPKDFRWLSEHLFGDVKLTDVSADTALLAIQGPAAQEILQGLVERDLAAVKPFHFIPAVEVGGCQCMLSRTGYTGEDGFELYCKPEDVAGLWQALKAAGKDKGLAPAGLGARDILRFEAALGLYGHELGPEISPLEAGLSSFVKLEKENFIGKEALKKQKEEGLARKLVGFSMVDRGIPREGYKLFKDGEEVGFTSSGSHSPTLGKSLGLGFVKTSVSGIGTEIEVEIRRRRPKAEIVKLPFYRRG